MSSDFKNHKMEIIQLVVVTIFFSLITYLASYKVLPLYGSIAFGDSSYFYNARTDWINIATTFSLDYMGQDQSNILFIYVPKLINILFLRCIGLDDNSASYVLYFGLYLVSCLTYYSIVYKISKNIYLSILSGLFVVLNNLSIEHIIMGAGFYYFYGLISFGILLYCLWNIFERQELLYRYSVLIILNSLLIVHPFYLIIYLMTFTLFIVFYFLEFKNIRVNILKFGITLLGIFSMHSYWLISFIIGSLYRSPETTYGGNLDNVFYGFLSISSYINAINFFQYYGFISKNFHQTIWHYIFYIAIVALLGFSLIYAKKQKNKGFLIFIMVSYLIFFNLALGPKSAIFGDTWLYLWDNVHLFKFFRTFSRFLIIIIPLYIIYFAILDSEWRYKKKNVIYITLIILVLFLNHSALTGDFNGNILATKIPEEYLDLNLYLERDKNINNIISYPNAPYEAYIWAINNNTLIIQQNYYLKENLLTKPIIYDRVSLNLAKDYNIFSNNLTNLPVIDYEGTFEKMNIGYVLIQKDLLNIFSMEPIDYQAYETYFNSNSEYQLIDDNKYFNIYEFNRNTSQLISQNIHFKQINPTKYSIFLKNINNDSSLYFTQNFHPNWKLYIKPNPSMSFCPYKEKQLNEQNNTSIIEYHTEPKFFEGEELSYLYKKSIFDNTHNMTNDRSNVWTIKPEVIKEKYSKEYYELNSDGSINIEFILYFKNQSYFYLGLIISFATVLLSIIYLTYDLKRRDDLK